MKRKFLGMTLAMVCAISCLAGCAEAPEISDSGEIPHAKSTLEGKIQNIVEGEQTIDTSGSQYDGVIGTQENGIKISAWIPAVPKQAGGLTLRESDRLTKEALREFIGSDAGNITDKTEELLAQQEDMEANQSGEDTARYSVFGDGSLLAYTDGNREACFAGNTFVTYKDTELWEKYGEIYKTAPEINIPLNEKEASGFSAGEAERMLLEKLEIIGITEINLYRILYYEEKETAFYELCFAPSYEGIGVTHELGQVSLGEVFPDGRAWIGEEGIAQLALDNYCGRIAEQETEEILDFSKVEEILEEYLRQNTLQCSPQVEMTEVEFEYYPMFHEPQLRLVPAWHIYLPLERRIELVQEEVMGQGAAWNIYINAVTGDILKVE